MIAHTGRTDWLAFAGVMMSGAPENTHTAGRSSTHVILLAGRFLSNGDARKEKKKKLFKAFLKWRTRERPPAVTTCFKGLHNWPLLASHLVTFAVCLFCLNTLNEQAVSFHTYKFMV